MIDFEDFESDDFGITIADLGLDIDPAADPLPPVPPRWRKPRWWHASGHDTLEAHAAETIRRYARPTLERLDAGEDDPVFEHRGAMVSLADLTEPFEGWHGLTR